MIAALSAVAGAAIGVAVVALYALVVRARVIADLERRLAALLHVATLSADHLRARDTWDAMSDLDPAHAAAWAELVEIERELRRAIALALPGPVAQVESDAWHRYRIALWIGLAVAAAVVGLVWIA